MFFKSSGADQADNSHNSSLESRVKRTKRREKQNSFESSSVKINTEVFKTKGMSASTRMDVKSSCTDQAENSHNSSSESRFKRAKRREKQHHVEDNSAKINTEVVKTKGMSSDNTDEFSGTLKCLTAFSGMKTSGAKRRNSSKVVAKGVGTADGANLCINPDEAWTVLAHKKPQKEWIPYNPRTMRPPPLVGNSGILKLLSWNVNGLRALLKLEASPVSQLAQREDFDILCLQETKLQEKDVAAIKQGLIDGYENSFWSCSLSKLGYSGTAIISRIKPVSVSYGLGMEDHDSEGRLVTAEFDSFYLLSAYVPNSGDGLKRLSYRVTEWDPSLSNYMRELGKSKPVILTGDLNCAHEEIDIFDPAGNKRSAGFTMEERESFGANLLSQGLVDTFRSHHPGVVGYTYWGYRHGLRKSNKGWRLDYFLVSESMAAQVHDSYILPDITGSDHCPVGLILKL